MGILRDKHCLATIQYPRQDFTSIGPLGKSLLPGNFEGAKPLQKLRKINLGELFFVIFEKSEGKQIRGYLREKAFFPLFSGIASCCSGEKGEKCRKGEKADFDRFPGRRADLVAPYRAILPYYRCDTPHRAMLFQGGRQLPKWCDTSPWYLG